MRAFLPVTVCCISLLCLHQQLLALPVGNSLERNRLNFLKRLQDLEQFESTTPGPTASLKDSLETIVEPIRERLRLHPIYIHAFKQNSRGSSYTYDTPKVDAETDAQRMVSRGRRHAHTGVRGHHPQLMRVGCVLGTCQVQNLSHRLWQLIGQSGREDSSPVNPKSPHSYG